MRSLRLLRSSSKPHRSVGKGERRGEKGKHSDQLNTCTQGCALAPSCPAHFAFCVRAFFSFLKTLRIILSQNCSGGQRPSRSSSPISTKPYYPIHIVLFFCCHCLELADQFETVLQRVQWEDLMLCKDSSLFTQTSV